VLDAGGASPRVKQAVGCAASNVAKTDTGIRFQRVDQVLPVAPPVPVDWLPREPCPVLKYCPYFLTASGLPAGTYEIIVEKSVLGRATHDELAAAVNLNEVYRKSQTKGIPKLPWSRIWEVCRDKDLDKDPHFTAQETVSKASWQWELRRVILD